MKKTTKTILTVALCLVLLCAAYCFILFKPYHTMHDFAWVTIGKTTAQQVNFIAPTLIAHTSFGAMSEYPTREGTFIIIRYYGPDLIVEDIREEEKSIFSQHTEAIESRSFYQITQAENGTFSCVFFDKQGNILKSEGPFGKEPHVTMLNDYIISFIVQAGTGAGTNWGYYYNAETSTFSDIFHSIHGQTDSLVVYSENDTLIVQDIFDATALHYTYADFQNPFANTVEPFVKVEFINDATMLRVTYLTGTDYEKVTEIFDIPNV